MGAKFYKSLQNSVRKNFILLFSHSIFWKPTKTFFIQYCASVHIRQLIWWVITKVQFSSSFWWVIIKVQFSSFFSGLSLKCIFPALFWCFITKVHFFGIFWWVITNVQFFEFFWEGYHKSAFFRHFWWVNKKVQFSIFPLWTEKCYFPAFLLIIKFYFPVFLKWLYKCSFPAFFSVDYFQHFWWTWKKFPNFLCNKNVTFQPVWRTVNNFLSFLSDKRLFYSFFGDHKNAVLWRPAGRGFSGPVSFPGFLSHHPG